MPATQRSPHSSWWDERAKETEKSDSKRKKAIMTAQVGDDRETVKVRGTPSSATPRREVTFVDLDEKPTTPAPLSERVRVGNGKKTVKVRR